jgi:hypothetical protein
MRFQLLGMKIPQRRQAEAAQAPQHSPEHGPQSASEQLETILRVPYGVLIRARQPGRRGR